MILLDLIFFSMILVGIPIVIWRFFSSRQKKRDLAIKNAIDAMKSRDKVRIEVSSVDKDLPKELVPILKSHLVEEEIRSLDEELLENRRRV